MFGFAKKMFIGLLSNCIVGSFYELLPSNYEGRLKCIS